MKDSVVFLLVFLVCHLASAQSEGGLEQYCYVKKGSSSILSPIVHYQYRTWYGEARHNYEDVGTSSIYIGKIFSNQNNVSYSITPIVGAVMGKYKGGSIGLKISVDYKNLFFSSESQYTFSSNELYKNFLYSWSELGYQPLTWMYAGLALQQTHLLKTEKTFETGVVVGFLVGKWTFPLYSFSPISRERYFVLGMNLVIGGKKISRPIR